MQDIDQTEEISRKVNQSFRRLEWYPPTREEFLEGGAGRSSVVAEEGPCWPEEEYPSIIMCSWEPGEVDPGLDPEKEIREFVEEWLSQLGGKK